MVTPLIFSNRDPGNKGRGPGYYYKRVGKIFSKYSIVRDSKKPSQGHPIDRVGIPMDSLYPHTTDGHLPGGNFAIDRFKKRNRGGPRISSTDTGGPYGERNYVTKRRTYSMIYGHAKKKK